MSPAGAPRAQPRQASRVVVASGRKAAKAAKAGKGGKEPTLVIADFVLPDDEPVLASIRDSLAAGALLPNNPTPAKPRRAVADTAAAKHRAAAAAVVTARPVPELPTPAEPAEALPADADAADEPTAVSAPADASARAAQPEARALAASKPQRVRRAPGARLSPPPSPPRRLEASGGLGGGLGLIRRVKRRLPLLGRHAPAWRSLPAQFGFALGCACALALARTPYARAVWGPASKLLEVRARAPRRRLARARCERRCTLSSATRVTDPHSASPLSRLLRLCVRRACRCVSSGRRSRWEPSATSGRTWATRCAGKDESAELRSHTRRRLRTSVAALSPASRSPLRTPSRSRMQWSARGQASQPSEGAALAHGHVNVMHVHPTHSRARPADSEERSTRTHARLS